MNLWVYRKLYFMQTLRLGLQFFPDKAISCYNYTAIATKIMYCLPAHEGPKIHNSGLQLLFVLTKCREIIMLFSFVCNEDYILW